MRALISQEDIHGLANSFTPELRGKAAVLLGENISLMTDREAAWLDLHGLVQDKNLSVRWLAAESLGMVFSYIPDKQQAWSDLIQLAHDDYEGLQLKATESIGLAFHHVPDKARAWMDLHELTESAANARGGTAVAIGSIFSLIEDKSQAWSDLHRLTWDFYAGVRSSAAEALGSAFLLVPDRSQAWSDLIRLIKDESEDVRTYAYCSLGRASVVKATEAEDWNTLLKELKIALDYFGKSSEEYSWYKPAIFCLPFYRSYFAITFLEANEDEVQQYLAEAKKAVGESKARVQLLEVVKNLAKALQEAQKMKSKSFEEIADELKICRWYCDEASKFMRSLENEAPTAIKLLSRCNPIIGERIKASITEIRNSAREIYEITCESSPEFKIFGFEINEAAMSLSTENIIRTQQSAFRIISKIEAFCKGFPVDKRALICKAAEEARLSLDLPEKFEKLEQAIDYIFAYIKSSIKPYGECLAKIVILTVLPVEYKSIIDKLSNLRSPQKNGTFQERYSWKFGEIYCRKYDSYYTIAVGMIETAGTIQSALAAFEATILWNPFYIFLVGVAGGFYSLSKADVVIANEIHGYEYGKIDDGFIPRADWYYRTEPELLERALYSASRTEWRKYIQRDFPAGCEPKVTKGEFASGDKVVDNPNDPFFKRVLEKWPNIIAVEMEGIGVGNAIEHVKHWQERGSNIMGFIMIRGISDLPRPPSRKEERGRQERDNWKPCASESAAAFAVGMIAEGLPIEP